MRNVRIQVRLCLLAASLTFGLGFHPVSAADGPTLSLPLDCDAHRCFLQSYVDMDPSKDRRDPYCGFATYNDHKGTDIRVRNTADLNPGIPVFAMADGTVRRLRNGVTDRLMDTSKDRVRVKGRECGNGVVIDHGEGWVSQTCHMMKGSLTVKEGRKVRRGQTIGLMGLSGATQFPHVHVTIRKNEALIDPVSGARPGATCIKSGTVPNTSLWDADARAFFQNGATQLLDTGFTNAPISGRQIVTAQVNPASSKGPVVFYAHFINLMAGDTVELVVKDQLQDFVRNTTKPLPKAKASYTTFTGKRGAVAPGTIFVGTATLFRDGKAILRSEPTEIRF